MAKRELSSQAAAAKMIRTDLKAAYPSITFSVKSSSFAGGDAVDIEWTDGPTTKQVEAITGKYQEGHFDGMTDMYSYDYSRPKNAPGAKYVQTRRDMSEDALSAIVDYLNRVWGYELAVIREPGKPARINDQGDWQKRDHIFRQFQKSPLVCHSCHAVTAIEDAFCGECGAPLTECQECHGNGHAWDNDENARTGYGWTEDPCPVCNGSGYAPTPQRVAA